MIKDELWLRLGIENGWQKFFGDGFNKQQMVATLRPEYGGSRIYFRSADRPDELRGMNLGWFAIDEASKNPQLVWEIMIGRLRHPAGPGQGWISTTPKGRNWVWEVFAKKKRPGYEWFQSATRDNKNLPPEYVASILEAYRGQWLAQEFYGEFTAWEGLVYPQVDVSRHSKPADSAQNWRYGIAGVDWGWIDPTVILIGLVGSDNQVHVVEEFYQKKTAIEDIVAVAQDMQGRWNVATYWCDPSKPESIFKFREAALDVRKGKNELDSGIATVSTTIDRDLLLFDFERCPNTLEEFQSYHFDEDDLGKITKTKPVDRDNHCMDALRYMIYSHNRLTGRAVSCKGGTR